MERLLELLYDEYDDRESRALLRDENRRVATPALLGDSLVVAGMAKAMRCSDEAANLFVAVLSLRIHFPLDEAREKVAQNIAMRERRRS
jgi:hypothetical protein